MTLPTLGQHDSTAGQLRGHCPGCAHSSVLDVEDLTRRFGPSRAVRAIIPHLRCTRCRHLGGEVTHNPINTGPPGSRPLVAIDHAPPFTVLPRDSGTRPDKT